VDCKTEADHVQESENHAVIQKLRSIGCDFGPCVNAYTGMEGTVYEFLIPTDEPEFLPQVLDTVAAFAFKVRCAPNATSAPMLSPEITWGQ
jgi:hypothetical protein